MTDNTWLADIRQATLAYTGAVSQSLQAGKDMSMDQNEVAIAFEIVLEEIENAIAALEQEGIQARQQGVSTETLINLWLREKVAEATQAK